MSFCPNKDIHSVYLDNELPEIYKADYEKHLEECPKCREELAKLKAVKNMLAADDDVVVDEKFLEESYERLMIKMAYSKNTAKAKKSPHVRVTYVLSAVAAAFMFALFLPVSLTARKDVVATSDLPAIENIVPGRNFGDNISLNSGNSPIVSGNIGERVLSSKYGAKTVNYVRDTLSEEAKGVDWLRPEFEDDNKISIRITIPTVGDIPINTSIDLQGLVFSGNYEWTHLEK